MYGFLGPNGAGKTTTVRMLVTLLRPTGGHARVAGYDVAAEPAEVRRRIGVALQEAALDGLMTGSELIELQATLHGIAPRSVRKRGAQLIERVGLSAAAGRRVATYSGGMRRRLDLAMALIHEPEVLFLDEPTTGLDPTSRLTLWDEVRRLRDEGTTVFLTTQYLEEADQLCDRLGIIAAGKIVAEGTPAALKAEVGRPHLDLVLADGSDLREAREVVRRFGNHRPTTEGCHLSIELAARRRGHRAGPARARRRGLRGRRARAQAADARRRLPAEDRRAPRGRGRARGGRTGARAGRRMRPAVIALARRALVNALRRPQFLAPLVVFPTLFLAINVGGLGATRSLEGFPAVDGFLDYQLASAILQSLLIGGVASGIAVALDIEGGFFDRIVASPAPRVAIVLGRVLAASVIAAAQISYFLVLGLVFGASIKGGVLGVLCVLVIGIVAGTGFGALGVLIAIRARNASTVQGIFPLVFVVLFISSAFFPLELLSSPADVIAKYNPLSFIAEGLRQPIAYSNEVWPMLEGLLAAGALAAVAIALSILALRGRLRDA